MAAWSEDEIRFLKDNIGNFTIGVIARKLNKPERACVEKASKLKIGSFKTQTDMFTISDAATQIGCSRKTVERYIARGRLKPVRRTIRNKTVMQFLKYDDVVAFAEEYSSPVLKPWAEREVQLLNYFLRAGYSHREIGNELGRSKASVERKARDLREKQKIIKHLKECIVE